MHKLKQISRLLLVLAMLAAFSAPAFAQESAPTLAEVTALARFFPDSTPVFFSMRIDDDYLAQVSDLSDRFFTQAGYDVDETLVEALERISQDYPLGGGSYADTLGALLGETVAFGLIDWGVLLDDKPENDNLAPYMVVVDSDSREDGTALLNNLYIQGDYTFEEGANYSLFIPNRDSIYNQGDPYVMVTDEALFFANVVESLPLDETTDSGFLTESASLAAVPSFIDMQSRLPAPSYNAFAYADVSSMFTSIMAMSGMSGMMGGLESTMMDAFNTLTAVQGVGFTVLDDNVLTMDIVQPPIDFDALAEFGLGYAPMTAVDPAFLEHVPAGTPLVLHGNNFGGSIILSFENAENTIQMQVDAAQASGDSFLASQLEQQRAAFAFVEAGLRGASGLEIEELFGWMSGDYILALGGTDVLRDATNFNEIDTLPIDFAFITAVTDADAAAAAVQGLSEALDLLLDQANDIDVTKTTETMGGTEVTVFSLSDESVEPFEIVVGANDEVFVIGSMGMARHALNPDGGLNTDESYEAASAYLVEGAALNGFVFGDQLMQILDIFMEDMFDFERAQFTAILLAFDQATLSSGISEDGSAARLTLNLPVE